MAIRRVGLRTREALSKRASSVTLAIKNIPRQLRARVTSGYSKGGTED